MKKFLSFILFVLWGFAQSAYADEEITIHLDNDKHKKETIPLPHCNIFIELIATDYDEGQYAILINLENLSEDKTLLLFDKAYSKKTLKKMSIVYDKIFQGAEIEPCKGLSESCDLRPSDNKRILKLRWNNEDLVICRLPIYIARPKRKNKIAIAQKEVDELKIYIELKPDEDFIRLSEAAENLINEIKQQTFCSNKNHQGSSLRTLFNVYNSSIDSLKNQVAKHTRNNMSSDKKYKLYNSIIERLDSIDFDELTVTSCENDRVRKVRRRTAHRCNYCTLSLEAIYRRMENYYIDLHNGKKSKKQVMGDVEALYSCATKNKNRAAGVYLSKISTYYNRIKQR